MRVVVERKKLQSPGYAIFLAASSIIVLVVRIGVGAALLTAALAFLGIVGAFRLVSKLALRRANLTNFGLKAEASHRTSAGLAAGWAEISPAGLVFSPRSGDDALRLNFADVTQATLRKLPLVGGTEADFAFGDGHHVVVTLSAPVSYVTQALGD